MTGPNLARVSGADNPFTILGAIVPKGAPMRALLQISDERTRLVAALREICTAYRSDGNTRRQKDAFAHARALLAALGEST